MKFIIGFSLLFFFHSTFARANVNESDCHEITYSATDYEFFADHDHDANRTCLAAGKAALWKACVDCAANAKAGDSCKVGVVQSAPDEVNKVCNGFAEAKINPCMQTLVHCTQNFSDVTNERSDRAK